LVVLGVFATFAGPPLLHTLRDGTARVRGWIELERQERLRQEHPEPVGFTRVGAEALLQAAAARTVLVYRIEASSDSASPGSGLARQVMGYRVVAPVQVEGMTWGRRLLSDVMRWATVPIGSGRSMESPRGEIPLFVVRFASTDTVDVSIAIADRVRQAVLIWQWRDASGHRRRQITHMDYPYEGAPSADSTFQRLRPMDRSIDPPR